MFDGLNFLLTSTIVVFTTIIGIISLGYGLYGMSVNRFDKYVQIFSIGFGITIIAITTSLYFFNSNKDINDTDKFIGEYRDINSKKIILRLKKNNTFIADTSIFNSHKGTWKLIDYDEFYKIDLNFDNYTGSHSFNIIEENNNLKLISDKNIDYENFIHLKKL
ncbi:MAG: hypothetical protein HYR91_14920 [Flavobacteriia bacterium]|nr:hypothetical protein [Flavobacteriia bacterium]